MNHLVVNERQRAKPANPGQLRSVKRNTMMLHQHKSDRHNATLEKLERMKEEKKRHEQEVESQCKCVCFYGNISLSFENVIVAS